MAFNIGDRRGLGRAQGRELRPVDDVRVPVARGLRRPRTDLRDHRRPRAQARARARRQADEPAGRAAHGRAPAVRQGAARCWWRSASAATRSGGSSALRSGTARRAPTAASTGSLRSRSGIVYGGMCAARGRDPARGSRRRQLDEPEEGDRRRARLARRHLDRRVAGSSLIGVALYQGYRGRHARSSSTTRRPAR